MATNTIDFEQVKRSSGLKENDGGPLNFSTDFPSLKGKVSEEEWKARVDLAAAYRLVDIYDMSYMIYNHITVRVPGTETFLINLYGLTYKEITASSLAKVDLDGTVVFKPEGTDYGINAAGYVIHSAIHKARKDINSVIHTHSTAGMAVAAQRDGLLPLTQNSMRFAGNIGYHDYEGPALSMDEQKRLVANLGNHNAMILRNHGLLAAGPTIAEAFNYLYQLETSCRAQVLALSAGKDGVSTPPEDVVELTGKVFAPTTLRRYGLLEWPAMLRKVEAETKDNGYPYYAS
ncbi:class II aldolase/adducin family protein [Mycobacterium sp.]|jgi:ribulose-5-phosphate 4-epimerase/fuculose-1-phosphate aldolase|uniref:class II aldolase/adducin family protein n=1 Tax=Mycobacterium sp. TaxID=1785 RepID=UPI002BFD2900|nr:class II aldolase/adducin family protein [Mycobacterium sp.]HXB89526.1 class II aldolase/adducin family protein [Mycobacterium sp.]